MILNSTTLHRNRIALTFVSTILIFFITSCASLFIPLKQKVVITTNNKNSIIYLENEEIGTGRRSETKVKKNGNKQIVIKADDYKTEYYVLYQTSRKPIAYWPLVLIDWCTFYGGLTDAMNGQKFHLFPKEFGADPKQKLIYKKNSEKNIDLNAIKIKVKDKEKDLQTYYISSTGNEFYKEADREEQDRAKQNKKLEDKAAKSKKKTKNKLVDEDSKIDYDDSKFSDMLSKTLLKTNYIDTVNRVFADNNNTVRIEGVIKNANFYNITPSVWSSYNKVKVNITWNIKNTFDELLDSVNLWSWSGDFKYTDSKESYKMYADAVDNSYYELMQNKTFISYLNLDTNFRITDKILSIKKPSSKSMDVDEATSSTVIVKRKDGGHGSGFAISNDGYIITNYHVIAGKTANKQCEVTVITSEGEEIPVQVIRFNKMRDIALLKVDKSFAKAFTLTNEKSYKRMMEVYTIGTPKSIELGQSVSIGLISNERKANNNNLLQLSMSINGGNSGGPLFDKTGTLQGVVTSKLVGYSTEGVGFAIPSYMIPEYLNLKME